MKQLNNYYNQLIAILLQDLAFYIPSKIVLKAAAQQELQGKISDGFFDDVFILDLEFGFGVFESKEVNERLLKKKTI